MASLESIHAFKSTGLLFTWPPMTNNAYIQILYDLNLVSRRSLARAAATQIPLDSVLLQAKENLRAV